MKKIILFALLFSISLLYAQTPQGISYQAIAFDTNGSPVINQNVGVKISILDNSINGTIVYSETHSKTTNAQGLFNLNIGQGTASIGDFSSINWGMNSKFLKVEIDPLGGTTYTSVGTNQLMSSPYALYAENINLSNLPSTIKSKSKTSKTIVVYTNTNIYGFYQNGGGTGFWKSQTLNGAPIGAVASNDNIVVYTNTNAYGFYQNGGGTGFWKSQTLNGTPIGAVASDNNIVVYTNTNAYGFYQNGGGTGFWKSQTLSGIPIGAVSSNINIVVYTSSNAYGFYQNGGGTGFWKSQTLNETPINAIGSSLNIVVFTNTNAYGFYQNGGGTGFWKSQSLNGTPIEGISK